MTKHNEDIVREVLDTLYEATGAILGVTALDTELEMQIKIRQNECATTRRIGRAISAIQQLELDNPWRKASEELPMYDIPVIVAYGGSTEDYCFNHRSNKNYVKTTQHGWCEIGYDAEPTHWMYIPEIKED